MSPHHYHPCPRYDLDNCNSQPPTSLLASTFHPLQLFSMQRITAWRGDFSENVTQMMSFFSSNLSNGFPLPSKECSNSSTQPPWPSLLGLSPQSMPTSHSLFPRQGDSLLTHGCGKNQLRALDLVLSSSFLGISYPQGILCISTS